jgi:hypothetical protein
MSPYLGRFDFMPSARQKKPLQSTVRRGKASSARGSRRRIHNQMSYDIITGLQSVLSSKELVMSWNKKSRHFGGILK